MLSRLLNALLPAPTAKVRAWRSKRAAHLAEAREWGRRIRDVVACPDNARLPRHPEAGVVRDGFQTMWNGLRVAVDGYYGGGMTELLRQNRGCHEPQEEVAFAEVLTRLARGSGMIELGAYWGFYSLWFARDIPDSRVWLVEPAGANLEIGRKNFAANRQNGHFTQALVGEASSQGTPPTICVDGFCRQHAIDRVAILHADIQGAEVAMLRGARATLTRHGADYVFISTHADDLHVQCVGLLREFGYDVEISIPPRQSFSFDGLIVSRRPALPGAPLPKLSVKPTDP